MENNILIQPKTITLTSVEIRNTKYDVNKSAAFSVILFKEENGKPIPVEMYNVEVEGDEFNAWGTDDNYIVDLVLSKLGLQKA